MPAERSPRAVAGIVLAAGTSSRMGRNKLLMEVGGERLLRRAVRIAADAGLAPVIVVLGHEADQALDLVADLPCRPIVNAGYLQGIQSSVRAGIEALPDDAAAVVIVLADMPLIDADMLATLVGSYQANDAALVLSRYGDVNAPPTLYDRSLFPELTTLEGRGCGKQVVNRHRADAITVDWPADLLTDLDEPRDLERLSSLIEGRQGDHRHAV